MVRFSSRIAWDTAVNRIGTALAAKRNARVRLVDLTASNPTAVGLVYPGLALEGSVYEPCPAGMMSAREAVSGYYDHRVPVERLLLTASTSEAYSYVFKLLCDPGDEVLVPRPSYPLFDYLAGLESVSVVQYPLFYEHGWSLDLDALRGAITGRTRALIFVHPNNPTGSYLKVDEYRAVVQICREHSLALLSDEVFADYSFGEDEGRIPSLALFDEVLTFTFSGLSKVSGLPQMKLGWIAVSGPGGAEAFERLETIADTFLSVGTPVQLAVPDLLAARFGVQAQIRERARLNLAYLRSACRDTGVRVLEVEAGWYATVRVPRTQSEEELTLRLLLEKDVLVQPGYFYDFDEEAFLVLSLLTPPADFQAGVSDILLMAS